MRSYLLALLIVVPAYAQNKCERLQTSLTSLEQSLLAKQLNQCDQVTPASVGITETLSAEDQAWFNALRCRNFADLDLAVSDAESTLVLIDGLSDLRTQVVATQQSLASQPNWENEEHESARQLSRDLTLGAAIQSLIQLPQFSALFNDNTSSGQWEAKLRTFCSAAPQNVSPFCALVTTYGSGTNPSLMMSDFGAFLDQLRQALSPEKTLSDTQKTEMLRNLNLNRNGTAVSFVDIQEEAASNGLLSVTNRLNPAQVSFVRNNRLSIPTETSGAGLAQLRTLLNRIDLNQNKLILKNSMNSLRASVADANERTLARIRARWSSLHLHRGGSLPVPCIDSTSEAEMSSCINTEWATRPSTNNTQVELFRSLKAMLESVADKQRDVSACLRKPSITAWMQNPSTVPDSCVGHLLEARSGIEQKRGWLLKLREKLAAQEDRTLRFRRFAYDTAVTCSTTNSNFQARTHEALPYCIATPSEAAFAPILELGAISQRISFVHEGAESSTVFDKDRDCPPGQQDEYAVLCEIAHGRITDGTAGVGTPEYRGTPTTLGTDAPTRTSDPILQDALMGVANDLANQYIRNRIQATQPGIYRWPQSPYRPMPYSQPISLSMSDFVIANGKAYGGFGQYYQCATCGYGSGPTAFNQRWGLGGANAAVGSLGGTNLSSRFFGGGAATFQF